MSLKVDFLGMELKTPFLVGSGPWLGEGSRIVQMIPKLAENWGGVVTKTYIKDFNIRWNPHLWSTRKYRGIGMQNAGPKLTDPTSEELEGLRKSCSMAHDEGLIVIGSIMGRWVSEWGELVTMMQESGVDAIELNLSCPARIDAFKDHKTGYIIGQNADLAAEAVHAAKQAASVPVIPKLTSNVTSVVEIAGACQQAGADALSAINTVPGIIGIDVETGIPLSSDVNDRAWVSGVSGPMIKPIGLRIVSELSREIDLPILGIGGIDGWESAAEYIMVGASAVQVCTAFMWKGYPLGEAMCKGLQGYLAHKGYEKVSDFQGSSLKYFSDSLESCSALAVIDEDRCNGCGECETACTDSSYGAISIEAERAVVDERSCVGCGLCRTICRREAIRYVAV